MIVLGIDPGFASFGWAAVEIGSSLVMPLELGVIRTKKATKKRNVRATDDNLERASEISAELRALLDRFAPVAIAGEAMSFPRSASVAAKMAMAWGVVIAHRDVRGLPLVQATPMEVKRTVTGNASASKEEVLDAIRREHSNVDALLVGIPKGQQEHPVDALAAVLACLSSEALRMVRQMGRAA